MRYLIGTLILCTIIYAGKGKITLTTNTVDNHKQELNKALAQLGETNV